MRMELVCGMGVQGATTDEKILWLCTKYFILHLCIMAAFCNTQGNECLKRVTQPSASST